METRMEDVSLHSVVQSLIDVAPGIEAANQQGRLRQGRPWRRRRFLVLVVGTTAQ